MTTFMLNIHSFGNKKFYNFSFLIEGSVDESWPFFLVDLIKIFFIPWNKIFDNI